MCPYQAFRAADGDIMLGVGNDAQWQRFCAVAGLQDQVDAPEFASNADRVRNFDATVALVQSRMETRTVAQWLALLKPAGIACSAIHTLDQALAHPQVAARELIVTSRHPLLGEVRNVGLPVRFGRQPREAALPAPLLGEHSREILAELGYADAEIDAMLAAGSVQAHVPQGEAA
jgi:formyl-CoA transferase